MTESERKHEGANGSKKTYATGMRAVSDAAREVRRVDQELIEKVRERPLLALGIALTAGYLVGRIFSRWG